ncbi:MAG TPA: Nif11-like leader peptide family RiPP precursor [Bosea sp. (in: a-proteobacteria)]|jgi:predicted ribosomally synthesized peptide with nif11-like leader|uniref:Nif11-like leader peptide family RiPP precursor n=1 Tax=Bosea sp. (in: a-proteobacteria) TaxID=1871050 RepID=UPI002E113836|nr:Nif11-like leader peptide family RiPP precursor [Bosea sp. (in: a-proteobacteria)]
MSTAEIHRFSADLKADTGLRAEAETYGTSGINSPDDIVAFAAAKGYDFNATELVEVSAEASGKEISDAELEGVSGGGDSGQTGSQSMVLHFAMGFLAWAFTPREDPSRPRS